MLRQIIERIRNIGFASTRFTIGREIRLKVHYNELHQQVNEMHAKIKHIHNQDDYVEVDKELNYLIKELANEADTAMMIDELLAAMEPKKRYLSVRVGKVQ